MFFGVFSVVFNGFSIFVLWGGGRVCWGLIFAFVFCLFWRFLFFRVLKGMFGLCECVWVFV